MKNEKSCSISPIHLAEEIQRLKIEKNAVILSHNYQRPEIQDIADFVGDSLALAQMARNVKAEIIVFCGVDFMAESAKILNPNKIVIHPNQNAECPMAAMVDVESLGWIQQENNDAVTVAYINTSAEVKTIVDVCCTSSNAVKVVKSLDEENIIFIPDINLGLYVKRFVRDKNMILWSGICPTHHKIEKQEILELKEQHPNAEILVHPECKPEVIDIADRVFSTQGMVNYVAKSSVPEFIIGTEKELCYRLQKENPTKTFYHLKAAICPNMKKITLQNVLNSLKTLKPEITLPVTTIEKAQYPLKRMMEIGRG